MDQRFEEQEQVFDENRYDDYIFHEGLFATQFPILNTPVKKRHVYYELPEDIVEVSDNFSGTVWNTGVMRHGRYYSIDTAPNYDGEPIYIR